MIPYGRQDIVDADVEAVVEVLRSDWLTQGPAVPRFENEVAARCGAAHGVAVNSATAALHAACAALGVGPGDLVWTVPNTFVASANCAIYLGADVDFVDVDARTYNMSVEDLGRRLETAAARGRLPKVVIPVHFSGQSCDMAAIAALARRHGIAVIEDASHAVGATWESAPVGSCRHSDVAVFSFHPVKIVTTGEGGMALTNDPRLAAAMRRFRSHGITRERDELGNVDEGGWYYEQQGLGFNYRLTDLQAALGSSQFRRLDAFLARRQELARRYDRLLSDLAVIRPWQDPRGESSWHLYVVQVDEARTRRTRREVFDALRAEGIGVNVHYIPVHRQPFHAARGFAPGDYPVAERYYSRAISLPMYYGLRDEEQDRVVAALQRALG